ncbi:hypothetical protein EVAR_43870_1 [Eumeta japonica]|uniref:Uncharacterized protein n=1 Tax=Eumeta variegata TaxID=151549 RepID=A0A4C1WX43_EUMVA|nr:hypothetical protein EVAR_43870_1 [Eumeta japonica]
MQMPRHGHLIAGAFHFAVTEIDFQRIPQLNRNRPLLYAFRDRARSSGHVPAPPSCCLSDGRATSVLGRREVELRAYGAAADRQ